MRALRIGLSLALGLLITGGVIVSLRQRAASGVHAAIAEMYGGDGIQQFRDEDGRLTTEILFDRGQWQWKKTYYPSGQVQTLVYEDWLFRTVTEHHSEDGVLISRTVR